MAEPAVPIMIRVTRPERNAIEKRAKTDGITMSEVLRRAVKAYLGK